MKILFLDIDGVICLSSEWGSRFKNKKEGLDSVFDKFNYKAIGILNEIIKSTDCEIIISSDWRLNHSLSEFRELFKERGIFKEPIGFTPYPFTTETTLEKIRSLEIRQWIGDNDPNNLIKWVAIDDIDLSPDLKENFIRTPKSSEGIKQCGIKEKIIEHLNR